MEEWGLVETALVLLAGAAGWIINSFVGVRKRIGEVDKKVAVVETRVEAYDEVAKELTKHTDSCTKTNNELKAEVNDVKTKQAVTNALLQDVKDGQNKIFDILDKMRR